MVDCISSLGGAPFSFDDWGADVVVTASQKCLMASPGLAFVAVSERAWQAYRIAGLTRNYWDFGAVRANLARPQPKASTALATPSPPPSPGISRKESRSMAQLAQPQSTPLLSSRA